MYYQTAAASISVRKYVVCGVCLFFSVCPVLLPVANWTVLTYAQAKNNLSNFAYKNFHDMTMIGSSPQLNILVEWHQPDQEGVWRYRVEKGKMIVDICLPEKTDGNSAKNLVDAMQWAVTKYPAKKYALILWNHGIGIIDPVWGRMYPLSRAENFIDDNSVLNNARIQIDGLTIASVEKPLSKIQVKDQRIFLTQDLLLTPSFCLPSDRRGILFNEQTRTYMDNAALTKALSEIKTKVLKNKKIDVLGMDACLMAMLEVGYQARQYAQYFIASQEVELAHGWNYFAFLNPLSQQECSSVQVVKSVVDAYGQYYKDRVNFYTQSAVNLEKIDMVKTTLEDIVTKLRACRCVLKDQMISVIKKARKTCVQFSMTNYIDLHSFLMEVQKHLEGIKVTTSQQRGLIDLLKISLQEGAKAVEDAVVANVTGENFTRAKGLSVYFPHGVIDQSYPKTMFAQESTWLSFIQEACRY